ncbi:uncharacterized protein LOC144178962 [Haemaphysalis longicornis]
MRSTAFAIVVVLTTMGVTATPWQDLIQRIKDERPFITYQCYRNGTSLEPASSKGMKVIWISVGENKLECHAAFSMPGVKGKTRLTVSAEYLPDKDMAIFETNEIKEQVYLLQPPYYGEAYLFKQRIIATGEESVKIYDTSETCENALALRQFVCPEPCNLENVQ